MRFACWRRRLRQRARARGLHHADSGLRNDDEAETFPVRHRVGEAVLPCQYVKIVPLLAWGANFNFSIWFVLLRGIADQSTVQNGMRCRVTADGGRAKEGGAGGIGRRGWG